MKQPPLWRFIGAAAIALTVTGWAGSASSAKWANPDLLVTPDIVKANANKADWAIVDCRSLKDYVKGHIPGAISLGKPCSKALRDVTSRLFRNPQIYENLFGKVGIGNNTNVVFYYGDIKTITSATVGFWAMEYLGHDKVYVLNGGLDAWRKAGNRLDNKPVRKPPTTFEAKIKFDVYSPTDEILKIARGEAKDTQLIDSRTKNEYQGKDIRAIRGGHVPNVTLNRSHVDTLLHRKNPKTGKMGPVGYLDPGAAEKAFKSLDRSKRTIAYCQTGTRSTLTYLELRLLGFKNPANWDDSWRVYGSQEAYPVADEQWYNFAGLNKKIRTLEKRVGQLESSKK